MKINHILRSLLLTTFVTTSLFCGDDQRNITLSGNQSPTLILDRTGLTTPHTPAGAESKAWNKEKIMSVLKKLEPVLNRYGHSVALSGMLYALLTGIDEISSGHKIMNFSGYITFLIMVISMLSLIYVSGQVKANAQTKHQKIIDSLIATLSIKQDTLIHANQALAEVGNQAQTTKIIAHKIGTLLKWLNLHFSPCAAILLSTICWLILCDRANLLKLQSALCLNILLVGPLAYELSKYVDRNADYFTSKLTGQFTSPRQDELVAFIQQLHSEKSVWLDLQASLVKSNFEVSKELIEQLFAHRERFLPLMRPFINKLHADANHNTLTQEACSKAMLAITTLSAVACEA